MAISLNKIQEQASLNGSSFIDAKKALEWTAQTTTPAPTGMAAATSWIVQNATPTPVMQAQVAPMEANIGGKLPETPIIQPTTPVVTPQAITTPTQVQKTTTTTPQGETIVKKETPWVVTPDYNVGKGREQDILTNLNEGYTKDLAIQKAITTGDYETYKQAYGYDTADQTKKTTLDAFFQARQPKNSESFLKILASGQKIQNAQYKTSPEAADAQHRYDVLSPYIGANATTIYDAMKSWKLYPGSDAYKDLLSVTGGIETPAMTEAKMKYEQKQQTDNINSNLSNISGNKPETTSGLQKISDNLVQSKGMDYATEFAKDVVNNPAITEKVTELNGVTEQIKNLEFTKSNSLKEIKKRYPGIRIWTAILLANQENEGINDELNQLYNKQGALKANVDYATNLAEKMFGYKIAQNQEAVKAQQDIASEERQFGRQKELAQFQQELGLQGNQAEFEQQMAQKAQIANDPVMATQDVLDTYAKLGILPERSNAEIIQSVQNDIASGMTLGESLTNLNKAFQSKPQYKESIAPKTGFTTFNDNLYKTDAQGNITLAMTWKTKPSDIKWTKLDDGMYQDAEGNIHTKQEMDQAKLFGNPLLNAKVWENVWVECGQYARTATGLTATPWGNSLEKRKQAFSDTNATPGGLVLFDGGGYDKTYGHIAVVTGVSADGKTITVKESNYNGDNKVTERTIPTTYVSGYYNNTPLAQGGEESPTISDKQFTQFNQMYSKFQSDKWVQAFESALAGGGDLIASLKSANWPGDVGAVFGFMKSLDPASVVKEGEFALAAKSAGVWEQFKNIPANKLEGAILTDEQRKAFGKLAFEYIKSKSKIYDIKYDDMAKILKNQNIPDSYMPTKMSDYIKEVEQGNKPETKTFTSSSWKTYNTNDYE